MEIREKMSKNYNFHFIHNPKTGGMSIRNYIKRKIELNTVFTMLILKIHFTKIKLLF